MIIMESNGKIEYLQYLKKGGKSGIYIKPSHRGRLTELKKRTGKTEAELYNDGNPAHKKMVTFARNSRKWKHQEGGLIYNPFVQTESGYNESQEQQSISDFIMDSSLSSFPIESVKPWTWNEEFTTYNKPHYEQVVPKGVTEFKNDKIDVGNMRELLDKFEEAGISVRVTSGVENRKTKSGKVSKHAVADAIDITPIKGETYEQLAEKIRTNPELLAYMRENGIGIIDETDPLMKIKTSATGDHWHISRGGEKLALWGFNKLFS